MKSSICSLGSLAALSVIVLLCMRKKWASRLDSIIPDSTLARILRASYSALTWFLAGLSFLMFLIGIRLHSTGLDRLTQVLLAASGMLAAAIVPPFGAMLAPLTSPAGSEAKSFYRQLVIIEVLLVGPFTLGLIVLSIWYLCS